MPQPIWPLSAPQSPFSSLLDKRAPVDCMVQPEEVCKVTKSVFWSLTPSRMSISPDEGQLGPKVQNAGHTPQVLLGICTMSAMKSPLV